MEMHYFVPSLWHQSYKLGCLNPLVISSVTMMLTQFKLYTVKINIHKVSSVPTLFLIVAFP